MLATVFNKKAKIRVGVEFQPGGIALAVQRGGQKIPSSVTFIAADNTERRGQSLKAWVETQKLAGAATVVALNAQDYQLFLLESPDVPEDELREAMQWRVKDLITQPLDDLVIDVFPMPEDGLRANRKMAYVVVAPLQELRREVGLIRSAGLRLEALDIVELTVRNVASLMIDAQLMTRGVAIARIEKGSGSVFLYRDNNLYLARNFRLDYTAGISDELPEQALAVELQRSMDYYERQMGQPSPAGVFLFGEHVTNDKIGDTLNSSFAVAVRTLDINAYADIEAPDFSVCVAAWGAALRQSVV